MQEKAVFDCEKERKRLQTQNRLLRPYERPALCDGLERGGMLRVLDIGCNDGTKTKALFSGDNIQKVIGLEYNGSLARAAQEKYGDEKFSFYSVDVESSSFLPQLHDAMAENGVKGFDLIYLSFVLMHLHEPDEFLRKIRSVLNLGGTLIVVEADDSTSTLTPDEENLLSGFLKILEQDPFSGNRRLGSQLTQKLHQSGYENVVCWCEQIDAKGKELEKKTDVFETFFSYLPEDVQLLRRENPQNEQYRQWESWLNANGEKLRRLILEDKSQISMGMKILSCTRGVQ